MIRTVDCPAEITLGPDTLDVHISGTCWRAPDTRIECRDIVVTLDGRDVSQEMLANESTLSQIKMRLSCEYWAAPTRGRECVTDGHDGGPDAA